MFNKLAARKDSKVGPAPNVSRMGSLELSPSGRRIMPSTLWQLKFKTRKNEEEEGTI
jgi:hypothetical protein